MGIARKEKKMEIVLVHESGRHDYGNPINIEALDFHREGYKEYIRTKDAVYWRYSFYPVISPYGYRETNEAWDKIIGGTNG